MRATGCLLLLLASAAHLTVVRPLPTESTLTSSEPSDFGLATLNALADRVNEWLTPVRQLLTEVVENRTATEVAIEARNATVNFANRVQQMEAFQSAQEVITPLRDIFTRMHNSVRDKTVQQLADDVQRHVQELDRSIAEFIRGFGAANPSQAEAETPDAAAATAAAGNATDADDH